MAMVSEFLGQLSLNTAVMAHTNAVACIYLPQQQRNLKTTLPVLWFSFNHTLFKPSYYFIMKTCFASLQTVEPTYPSLVPFKDFDPGTDAARIETAIKTKGKGSRMVGICI